MYVHISAVWPNVNLVYGEPAPRQHKPESILSQKWENLPNGVSPLKDLTIFIELDS